MKHYGKNVQKIIETLVDEPDTQAVEAVIANLARYMRTKSYEYNQEHPNNEVIIKDIKTLSDHTIKVDEIALNNLKSDYKQPFTAHQKKGAYQNGRQQKNTKSNKNQQGKAGKQHRGRAK